MRVKGDCSVEWGYSEGVWVSIIVWVSVERYNKETDHTSLTLHLSSKYIQSGPKIRDLILPLFRDLHY